MKRGEFFPRIALALLDPQGYAAPVLINIEYHHLNFVADLNNLRRVNIAVSPVHLGYVNQSLNTFLKLRKATVVSQISNLRHGTSALWVSTCNRKPRILSQLLETKRHTISFPVELEHLHVNLIANGHDFTWMFDTLPRHIRDV